MAIRQCTPRGGADRGRWAGGSSSGSFSSSRETCPSCPQNPSWLGICPFHLKHVVNPDQGSCTQSRYPALKGLKIVEASYRPSCSVPFPFVGDEALPAPSETFSAACKNCFTMAESEGLSTLLSTNTLCSLNLITGSESRGGAFKDRTSH